MKMIQRNNLYSTLKSFSLQIDYSYIYFYENVCSSWVNEKSSKYEKYYYSTSWSLNLSGTYYRSKILSFSRAMINQI